jgi:hypothetical protein
MIQMCKSCSTRVNLQTGGKVTEKTEVSAFFDNVGIVMFDGLTSMNEWIMGDMADKTGRGELKGETAMGRVVSGDMIFGGSTRNHYGYAQTRSAEWISDATNIQGLVIGPVFTARKQRATDANSNIKVYGPQIAGQAKTSDVPAWVGNCLGATTLLDEKGRKEYRLYLTEYKEPGDDILHLCKTRAAPGMVPDFLSDGPVDPGTNKPVSGVEAFTDFNLGHFMDLMESATGKTLEETLKLYPDAPGLTYLDNLEKEADKVKQAAKEEAEAQPEEKAEAKPVTPKPGVVTKPKPGAGLRKPAPQKPVLRKPGVGLKKPSK